MGETSDAEAGGCVEELHQVLLLHHHLPAVHEVQQCYHLLPPQAVQNDDGVVARVVLRGERTTGVTGGQWGVKSMRSLRYSEGDEDEGCEAEREGE